MTIYKRRVRIHGDEKMTAGCNVVLQDFDTKEELNSVTDVNIHICWHEPAIAQLTYFERDENNRPVVVDGSLQFHKETVQVPSLDITALEPVSANELKAILVQALTTDEAQHKQWLLWQIADMLGIRIGIRADQGKMS